jgi:hypothetical protein
MVVVIAEEAVETKAAIRVAVRMLVRIIKIKKATTITSLLVWKINPPVAIQNHHQSKVIQSHQKELKGLLIQKTRTLTQ